MVDHGAHNQLSLYLTLVYNVLFNVINLRPHFRYKQNLDSTFGERERQKLTRELIELRSALSDVNVFIHAERQQVALLYAENERLQVSTSRLLIDDVSELLDTFSQAPNSYISF